MDAPNWSFMGLAPAGATQGGISVLPSQYPYVYRDNVTNDFFGTTVADPYRWLENTDSNATLACEALPAISHSNVAAPVMKGMHVASQCAQDQYSRESSCASSAGRLAAIQAVDRGVHHPVGSGTSVKCHVKLSMGNCHVLTSPMNLHCCWGCKSEWASPACSCPGAEQPDAAGAVHL